MDVRDSSLISISRFLKWSLSVIGGFIICTFSLRVFKLCGGVYDVGNMQFEKSITIDTKSFICVEG